MAPQLRFRPAEEDDLPFLRRLRNDPLTRTMSRRQQPFSLDDVRRWVFAEGREFVIASSAADDVGFLSYEPLEAGHEISIVVAPEHRAKGIGKRMLDAFDRPGELHAQIRKDNAASLRLFRACGFYKVRESDEYEYFTKLAN